MKAKENVLKAINGQKPERLPVTVFSGGAWTFNKKGLTLENVLKNDAALAAEIIVRTNESIKSDIVWAGSGFNNLPVRALGGKIKFRVKGTMDVQEPLLRSAADVDRFDVSRLEEDEGIRNVWETAALVSRFIGEETLVGACGWGPFTLAAQFYGVERMMRSLYRDPASVHAVLEFAVEVSFRYYEPFIKAGARIISIAEPTSSGDLISREHFRDFAVPYTAKILKRIKGSGALTLLHICGDITDCLDLIPGIAADVLSVDYKVDLARVRETVGPHMAFAGNINPAGVLVDASPAEVAAVSRACIEKAGRDGNYILMPGCDLSTSVPVENVRAMIETGLNYLL
jgi:uroporphyrinogen decarboxylase